MSLPTKRTRESRIAKLEAEKAALPKTYDELVAARAELLNTGRALGVITQAALGGMTKAVVEPTTEAARAHVASLAKPKKSRAKK